MIITDEALLRVACTDASLDEIDEIISQLESELKRSADLGRPGIGLASPQIGIHKNVAIIRVPTLSGDIHAINLVNCEIAAGYNKTFFDGEGCLSFPNRTERTFRYQEIYVVNNLVEPKFFTATGLLAVCIQHELNHLDGILLPDVAIK